MVWSTDVLDWQLFSSFMRILGKLSHGEKQFSGSMEWNLMKSHFDVKFIPFFFLEKKWYMLWLKGIFLYFWRILKIFLNPKLSLIVPVTALNAVLLLKRNFHKNVSCRSCQLTCSKFCVYCDASKRQIFLRFKEIKRTQGGKSS